MRTPVILTVLVVAGFAELVAAQETTGNLEGLVRERGRGPLPGVEIIVTGPSLPGSRRSRTDAQGYFQVLRLPVGSYTVQLTRVGVRPLIVPEHHGDRGARLPGAGLFDRDHAKVELDPARLVAQQRLVLGLFVAFH
jgi:hypothetical protein